MLYEDLNLPFPTNFITNENPEYKVTEQYIEAVEKKFNFTFPDILKDYYLNHNGASIKDCPFVKDSNQYVVIRMVMLKYGPLPFEIMAQLDRKNNALEKSWFPLAEDEEHAYYYFDANTGKVYYVTFSAVNNDVLIADSIEDFFEIMNSDGEILSGDEDNEGPVKEKFQLPFFKKRFKKG